MHPFLKKIFLLVAFNIYLTVLQVNTLAAEKLYSLAGDWAGLGPDTLLFDVCCGTGTIGLTLAHRVGMVIVTNPVPAFFLLFRHVIRIVIVQCPKQIMSLPFWRKKNISKNINVALAD